MKLLLFIYLFIYLYFFFNIRGFKGETVTQEAINKIASYNTLEQL